MERILSEHEEWAIRLCHHDFAGMTTDTAAGTFMKVSQRRIQQLLRSAEQKAPQLFPILTKHQVEIRWLINDAGLTFEQVAETLRVSVNSVSNTVQLLKVKGVLIERRKKTVQYQNWHDSQIKEKF